MSTPGLALNGGAPAISTPTPAWPVYDQTDADALVEVLNSGRWGSTAGDVVQTFEAEFAAHQDSKYGFALNNGTLALAAALRAGGVGIGDEVIVPPYTFIATAAAALFVGAVPVFADVDPTTHLLDPEAAKAAITERTKAIIPVHLAGAIADMDAFAALGREHDLLIVEDSAQATGAAWKGTAVGSLAGIGTFSFQSSKNLTAGEGGAVTTNDEELANALYAMINVGRVRGGGWYEHTIVGWNLRMTEFQGALLRTQLGRLDAQQKERDVNAVLLDELLADVEGVTPDATDERWTSHGRHLYMMRFPAFEGNAELRDAALKALHAEGLAGASSGYVPLHRNEAVVRDAKAIADRLGQPYPEPQCPVTDELCRDTIWLPQSWLLGNEETTRSVAAAITKVVTSIDDLR
ncbi:MAG TPA: DegT/DnrJ/EryC1/StrS family aminotransferase [Candidatus Avipropionibacterium avicola]|uniref:DegT/DnrJ/EryC1/StrS family aminotransferase n=1 Tax=Candidatus Avipropionibacterium avicola TaxID=2840701 RepID=A0A9D1KM96_9ACTN|nr:DegT/DnrJ/EryC1/StrS family aminotransferase [Candidatus Avipropionibacterium avicola]